MKTEYLTTESGTKYATKLGGEWEKANVFDFCDKKGTSIIFDMPIAMHDEKNNVYIFRRIRNMQAFVEIMIWHNKYGKIYKLKK